MTTCFLVRHGAHDLLGHRLAGRMPGVRLNAQGQEEARRVAKRLERQRVAAIYTSPLERAQETAAPLAALVGREPEVRPLLTDVDFGEWTNRTFEELRAEPQWPTWCHQRTQAVVPSGETIGQVQARAVGEVQLLAARHPEEAIVVFAHGDVLKSIIAHYLGISLDALERFEIAPGSISTLLLGADWAKVQRLNETGCW